MEMGLTNWETLNPGKDNGLKGNIYLGTNEIFINNFC